MTNRTCDRCHVLESASVRFRPPTIIAGAVLHRDVCDDVAACTQRRLQPIRTYSEAHRAVVAARKASRS